MKTTKWLNNNIGSLANKNIVVIGATGGLGKELCFALSSINANLYLAYRNEDKANNLKNSILHKYPKSHLQLLQLNQENYKNLDKFIDNLKKIEKIDTIFFNSGIYNVPVQKLENSYNNVFNVNFLSVYYIIKKLLEKIKNDNTKIIAVGSIAHSYSKINLNDIDFSTYKKSSKIYGNSKRFLMFSLYELAKKEQIDLAIVHPGITLTNMTNHYPKAINWLVKIGIKILFPTPQKAVLNLIYGLKINTPYHTWIGPKIFNIWGRPKLKEIKTCTEKESKKIFEIAENLYKKMA